MDVFIICVGITAGWFLLAMILDFKRLKSKQKKIRVQELENNQSNLYNDWKQLGIISELEELGYKEEEILNIIKEESKCQKI